MIEIIRDINSLSEKTGIAVADFPVFYFKEYYKGQALEIVFFVSGSTVVPLALSKHYFLKKVQLLFVPLDKNQRLTERDEHDFFNELVPYLRQHRFADRIIPPSNYCIFHSFPEDSVVCPFGTYFIDLLLPLETLWENLHSKHRNVIRNAEKKGAILKTGTEQLPIFYRLYVSTMQRSQLPYPSLDYFRSLVKNLPEKNSMCAVVYFEDKPQGALLIPYSLYGAYYVYGASAEKVELTGSNNYMHWEVIKLLKARGLKRYDFVGARLSDVRNTKLSGIQLFKERFGSTLERGYIWKMDLTVVCKIYDFLVRTKDVLTNKKNAYIDIIDQERSKNLPTPHPTE